MFSVPSPAATWGNLPPLSLPIRDLIDSVVVLRPTRHKIGHFGHVSPSQSLGLVWKKLNVTQQKARIHQSKEMYYNTK